MNRHSLSTVCLLALILGLPTLGEGQVYKVVDDKGNVTYTDRPPPVGSGERVSLPPINTQPGIEVPPRQEAETTPQEENQGYRRVDIIQPPEGLTLPPGQLDLVVQARLEPVLQAGHLIRFVLNGTPLASPASATSIHLENLLRGTHRIEAEVLDERGRVIAVSPPVEFYVLRASRLNPSRQ